MSTAPTLKLGNMIATPTASTTPEQVAAARSAGWQDATPASAGLTPAPAQNPAPANPLANFSTKDTTGRDSADINSIISGIGNANPTPAEMDYVRNQFQAQIDALNNVYATERARLIDEGKGRMNQVGAIQARQGLLGTGFAGQQDDAQTKANNDVLAAADAKHNADIASVMGKISDEAKSMATNRYNAAKSGADALITSIRETPANRDKAVNNAVQYLLDSGIDPTKVTPDQLQGMADKINTGNSRYGVTAQDISTAYSTAKKSYDQTQAKAKLEQEKTAADIASTKATTAKAYADTKKILNDMNSLNSSSSDTPLDPTSNSILAQTGLSVPAFNFLTQGTSALTRMSEGSRKQVMKEAQNFLNKNGIDISTFQSQYKAYNEVLQNNIKRMNSTKIMENELDGTLANLGTVASDADLGKLSWGNVVKIWGGQQVNDPVAQKYSFHLQQLRNELAGYFAASQGKTSPDVVDNQDAEKAIKDGIDKGTITGLQEAVKASTEKMAGVMQNSVDSTNKAVWQLFGVGSNFKPAGGSPSGTTMMYGPDGIQYNVPNEQVDAFTKAGGHK